MPQTSCKLYDACRHHRRLEPRLACKKSSPLKIRPWAWKTSLISAIRSRKADFDPDPPGTRFESTASRVYLFRPCEINILFVRRGLRDGRPQWRRRSGQPPQEPRPEAGTSRLLDFVQSPYVLRLWNFRGFDSSRIFTLGGWILLSMGDFPESLSPQSLTQAFWEIPYGHENSTLTLRFCLGQTLWNPDSKYGELAVPRLSSASRRHVRRRRQHIHIMGLLYFWLS